MLTLQAAYGRSYRSKKAVEADWKAEKDFVIIGPWTHPDCNRYVNRPQLAGIESQVKIRYGKRLDRVCVLEV